MEKSLVTDRLKSLTKKVLLPALVLTVGVKEVTEYGQDRVNEEHEGMNHVISVATMSTREKVSQLLVSSHSTADQDSLTASVYEAVKKGDYMIMVKDAEGSSSDLAGKVSDLIDAGTDLDHDGKADISEEVLNASVTKALELKAKMGLITKLEIKGDIYYALNPEYFSPSTLKVLRDSFFSNQWPWLSKDEYYEVQGQKNRSEWSTFFEKAGKNFALSFWRTMTDQVDPRFAEAQKNPKKLIVVDKSVRYLFIYDLETGQFEKSFEIAIGKGTERIPGGEGPRRISGDFQTPTGFYEVVGKRDDQWWRENKGGPLPSEYGGSDGGMIVLAGPWHPEIAFHASDGAVLGAVSNGCVRMSKDTIDEFLKTLPLGSMVVITN